MDRLCLDWTGFVAAGRESSRLAAEPGAVEICVSETATDEAEMIASRIAKLIKEDHAPETIAALYRSVRTSARPLVDALRSRDIPVMVVGKTSLLARPEMALIARVFVLWEGGGSSGVWYPNPEYQAQPVTRESVVEEIASVARIGSREAERRMRQLDQMGEQIRVEGVTDSVTLFNEMLAILKLPGEDQEARFRELGLGRMSELMTEFDHSVRRAAPASLYRDLPRALVDEAEEDSVLAADRVPESKPQVLGATRGQIYLIRLKAFLEHFAGRAAEETPDTAPEARNAVQIMTVHQAKGLEFPIVFVPSLIEGRFPSALMGRPQRWYVPAHLFDRERYEGREDDEARLLYVAMTRAKELLGVSWFTRHRVRATAPSRFLTRHLKGALGQALRLGDCRPESAPRLTEEDSWRWTSPAWSRTRSVATSTG
jgi:DNA helicase-2/ATP-dependent DNA helicase PcrA